MKFLYHFTKSPNPKKSKVWSLFPFLWTNWFYLTFSVYVFWNYVIVNRHFYKRERNYPYSAPASFNFNFLKNWFFEKKLLLFLLFFKGIFLYGLLIHSYSLVFMLLLIGLIIGYRWSSISFSSLCTSLYSLANSIFNMDSKSKKF